MRIIGVLWKTSLFMLRITWILICTIVLQITCPTEDGSLQTLRVRSPLSLQNGTVCKILPWFFSQAIPLFDVLADGSVVIRLQTQTDPFCHLRRRKDLSCKWDGKGFNLQRSARHGGFVCIDGWLRIAIADFNLLCPGFFYGTAKHPNLNILLSQRLFRHHVVNASQLWTIMYDCLNCRQFTERQQTDGDFKQQMLRNYYATQLKYFRPEIAELEERIEMSNKYSKLNNSLQQMIATQHTKQVQRYKDDVKQLKLMLRETVHQQEQLLAKRLVHEYDTTEEVTREITALKTIVRKNELENLLAFCQGELFEAKANLELRKAFETSVEELKTHFNEMDNIVDEVNSIQFLELELENVRCSIENNQSFLMLSKISNDSEKRIYVSNLKIHEQSLKIHIKSTQDDVNRMEREKNEFIREMQTLKHLWNGSTANNDSHRIKLLGRLQQTIVEIVETTDAITRYETKIGSLQQQIWHSYMEMSINVRFIELVSIAAVKLAIEILDAKLKEDFLGFVYELALEAGIRTTWCEGLSCSAIFRSMNSVAHVKQLIEKEQTIKTFQYIVLRPRVRTSLNTFLSNNVPEGDTGTSYEETVANVNTLVQHMVEQLRTKRELHATAERLEHLTATKEKLLAKVNGVYSGSCIQCPRTKLQELPNLVNRTIAAKNYHTRFQARYDALEKFIHQIENDDPLPNAKQLKLEESRLNEELKTILQEADHNKKLYYKILSQLTTKCDTMQFVLQRYEEDFCSMPEALSSTVCGKLIDCWTACSALILRIIPTIEDAANQLVASDEETPADISELNEQIQSLDLREKSLASRITCTETMMEDYQRENKFSPENKLSQFSLSRRQLQESEDLLNKIVSARKELQQIPPGCNSTRNANMKVKLDRLYLLERHRTEVREMCLNNLILPIIDKLHVQKLRQVCQLVTSVSEDLPELGGKLQVFFEYEHGPEYEECGDNLQSPFSLRGINSVHINAFGDESLQVTLNTSQQHLAYLILYISFLYCDGCKLLVLNKSCEQLFDGGIVSLFYVLEKHFPTMQVFLQDRNTCSE